VFQHSLVIFIFLPFFNRYTRIVSAIMVLMFHCGLLLVLRTPPFIIVILPMVFVLLPPFIWDKITKNWKVANSSLLNATNKIYPPLREKYKHLKIAFFSGLLLLGIYMNLIAYLAQFTLVHIPLARFLIVDMCNCLGYTPLFNMFSPQPPRTHNYFVVVGETKEGELLNLYSEERYDSLEIIKNPWVARKIPLELYVYLNIMILNNPAKMNSDYVNEKVYFNWCVYATNRWEDKHPERKLKKVFVKAVGFYSEAPGVFSPPKIETRFSVEVRG